MKTDANSITWKGDELTLHVRFSLESLKTPSMNLLKSSKLSGSKLAQSFSYALYLKEETILALMVSSVLFSFDNSLLFLRTMMC